MYVGEWEWEARRDEGMEGRREGVEGRGRRREGGGGNIPEDQHFEEEGRSSKTPIV